MRMRQDIIPSMDFVETFRELITIISDLQRKQFEEEEGRSSWKKMLAARCNEVAGVNITNQSGSSSSTGPEEVVRDLLNIILSLQSAKKDMERELETVKEELMRNKNVQQQAAPAQRRPQSLLL